MTDKQITIVVAVIRDEQGRILLAKRHEPHKPEIHGRWELVGGGIEFGETPEQALVREVKEETGADVEIIKLFPKVISDTQTFNHGGKLHVLIIGYECRITGGQLAAQLDNEISELKFFAPQEIKNLDAFNNIKELAEILSH
ncbi:MAG: NUDIX hydrolase [Patescibacteria group bacterium]|nr:NUDIX hydrolase [Patescibacteria group bacterium]